VETPEGCDVSNRFLDSVMPSAAAVAASALGPISSSAVVAGLNKGVLNSMMPSARRATFEEGVLVERPDAESGGEQQVA